MKRYREFWVRVVFCISLAQLAVAQTPTETPSALPRLVRFSGTAKDLSGNTAAGVTGITFALYAEQTGGAPLWQETQNVIVDSHGHYTALLGSTTSEGLPADLFNSEQAHWVGVQVEGQAEQPRVLLVSVPYALKASDADTLGGKPASAYLLSGASGSGQPEGPAGAVQSAPAAMSGKAVAAAAPEFTSSGTANFIAKFTDAAGDVGNSVMSQNGSSIGINTTASLDVLDVAGGITAEVDGGPTSGPALDLRNAAATGFGIGSVNFYTYPNQTVPSAQWQAKDIGGFTASQTLYTAGNLNQRNQPLLPRLTIMGGTGYVGVGTTAPVVTLDVNGSMQIDGKGTATAAAGQNSYPLNLVGSVFDSLTGTAVQPTFQLQVEPVGNDTATPTGALSLLYGQGGIVAPQETGLKIASSGVITFAAGQTFPGSGSGGGTVTSVGSGAGLTGGPITTSGTLSIAAGGVSNAMLANSSLSVNAGSGLTGGGSVALGGSTTLNLNTSNLAQLNAANTFTASQTANVSTAGSSGLTGNNAATSGSGTNGVSGNTSSPNGAGLAGVNTSSGGHGVYGATSGTSSNNPAGVYGTATVTSTSVATYGVYGTTASTANGSAGVYGTASTSTGSEETYGVYGATPNVNDIGVGVAGTGTAISGQGQTYGLGAGVWGDVNGSNSSFGGGVVGTADSSFAVFAANNAASVAAVHAENDSTTPGALVFETVGGGQSPIGTCKINVNGDLDCSGTLSPLVQTGDARDLKLYGVASPENWFEDFGSGQLSGGSATISLDPAYASTVDTSEAYRVFLTPNGDCKGLYVAGKTAGGFEVHELGGGTSSVPFDYRIVAKRRGYENVRLEDVTEQVNKMRQRQAEMQARRTARPAAAPQPAHTLPMKASPVTPK
jgi:hypothetical protein